MLLETPYGNYTIEQPLIDLINSPTIQRLKKIYSGGVYVYSNPKYKDSTRYEHSIGVLVLLKCFGAGIKEQIAGLLHDASHTVFSHVGDYVFNHSSHHSSYQDDIHEWFLKKQNLDLLLEKYNFSLEEILHKSGHHTTLEQDLPNICADRLEYNLRCAMNMHFITTEELSLILENLKFEKDNFFFLDKTIAKKFASISLYFTETFWADATSILTYQWLAKAINRAVALKLITYDDIHFSFDDIVWKKLNSSSDKEIQNLIEKILNFEKSFKIGTLENHDQVLYGKFRGIDPFVKIENNLFRLTEIDPEFKNEFNRVKTLIKNGIYVKIY